MNIAPAVSNGMVATRRSIPLVPFREPSRLNLFDSLVEYWACDEPGGARIGKIKNKLIVPTATNANAAGLASLASVFGGSGGSYLSIASDSDLQLGNIDFTVMAWVNLSSTAGGTAVGKDDAASLREHDVLRFNSTPAALAQLFNGVSTSVVAPASATLSTATWYLCTAVFDHTTPKMYLYINTTPVNATPTGTPGTNSTAFSIGGDVRAGSTQTLAGSVMRVAIWKRQLTADEITYMYNGGQGRNFPWL